MQFNDDQSGVPTFMVGIVILVMAGVALSILVDKRAKASSEFVDLQKEIRVNDELVGDLKFQREERAALLQKSGGKRRGQAAQLVELGQQAKSLKQQSATALAKSRELSSAITSLESESLRYRNAYRQKSWAMAVGEKLGTLKLKSGREYEEVTISRVTEAGLEISHHSGIARIPAQELDRTLRERFQFKNQELPKLVK